MLARINSIFVAVVHMFLLKSYQKVFFILVGFHKGANSLSSCLKFLDNWLKFLLFCFIYMEHIGFH